MSKKLKHSILLSLAVILVGATGAMAQADSGMIVHRDSRIEVLLKKQGDINKVAGFKTSNGQYKGYRIMVLNTTDRELAYKTKGQLLSRFPDHSVYMSYQAPFFKLKAGDFIKKEDAEDLRKRLSSMMPKGVFVVPEIINVKPEDEKKYLEEIEEKGG
ncbi:MAG: SPOR domain-containing protein [Bacteroidota bacterium]